MATQSPAGADIVLIADDNASLRSKIVEFLKMEGIQSVEAMSKALPDLKELHVNNVYAPMNRKIS